MIQAHERTTKVWVLALTSAASFMVSLDSQVVAAALKLRSLGARSRRSAF
jgi:hypothetical protein